MHMLIDGTAIARMRKDAGAMPMLDAEREAELVRRIQQDDDAAAMRELLAAHFRLVISHASRYVRAGISDAELVAEGNVGLVEAARRFDSSKGARFSTYATLWIRARIGRFVLGNRRIVSAPSTRNARKLFGSMRSAERLLEQRTGERPTRAALAAATGTSEEDVAMVEAAISGRDLPIDPLDDGSGFDVADEESPEALVSAREESESRARQVAEALGVLDRREREILQRRLLDDGDGETLASIGRVLGLSRERVRQIEAGAKRKLHAALIRTAA
ncbi:MAG: sigma-70 family RNA polymerase sigma factor [Myxococcota bacterium]|nr:sigma-70 family RNA polymerase sigma factor [Myxococcota bacterium]